MRLPTEVPRERWHGLAFLSLVLLVELVWAAALGYLALRLF